ncbi:Proteasome maturation protein [Heterocephalus glaber]|uniref:Proteasome maturation protein n=2 Tax=Heterocephalus glaber TaxID=10181 RepID=G5ATU3_HETGA|nr:proteasome maturation protein [Heterocephalus glaber]EHB00454.1 Proteasome maturation protein [Heterocephalus glaber]
MARLVLAPLFPVHTLTAPLDLGPLRLQAWELRSRAAPSSRPAPSFLPSPDGRTSGGCVGAVPGNGSERRGRLTVTELRGCSLSGLKMNTRGLGSQLKDTIPVTELSASGPFESHDLLRKGFSCVKNELLPSHPLELSEKNFQLNQDKMNFSTLRNIQGLFAPLKLQMEFRAVQQVQRLPFLSSSNLSLDILRGNDETIGFKDILNDPSQSELMGEPHLMVEYKLGLL